MEATNKMSRYGEAIGVWHLTIGGADLKLKPKTGDNYKLMEIMKLGKERNDELFTTKQISGLVKEIIMRDYPPLTDQDKADLDEYVEFNAKDLMVELLVKFRWTTKDELNKLSVTQKKN